MTSTNGTSGGLVHAPQTARDDWPAESEARRSLGLLIPGKVDPAAIRAADIFGFDAILRPTWIYVARTGSSMSMSMPWFHEKWARLKNSPRQRSGRPVVLVVTR